VPEWLFQHHARLRIHQARAVQVGADGSEQGGRGGQVVHAVGARTQRGGQAGVVLGARGVQAHVHQAFDETAPGAGVQLGRGDEGAHLVVDEGGEGGAVPGVAPQGHDARVLGQCLVQVRHVEGRQQLAHREIARAAEDDEVERGLGFGVCLHGVRRYMTVRW
jgi:hypothetical protein